jgi:hypothetical protein
MKNKIKVYVSIALNISMLVFFITAIYVSLKPLFEEDYTVNFMVNDHSYIRFMIDGKMDVLHSPDCLCFGSKK